MLITHKRLLEIVHYDPETGIFTWHGHRHGVRDGKRAGYQRKGKYRGIILDRCAYAEHRVVWFYMTGKWPPNGIDHRNRDPSDNRWNNLRLATQAQNNANMRAKNSTGLKGVSKVTYRYLKKPYRACIKSNGKNRTIGFFSTPEEAHKAYMAALKAIHGDFASP